MGTTDRDYSNNEPLAAQPEFCETNMDYEMIEGNYTLVARDEPCGKQIETMAFKGTGVCGEVHRKARDRGARS